MCVDQAVLALRRLFTFVERIDEGPDVILIGNAIRLNLDEATSVIERKCALTDVIADRARRLRGRLRVRTMAQV